MRRIDVGLDVSNREGAINYSYIIKGLKGIKRENMKETLEASVAQRKWVRRFTVRLAD